MLRPITVVLCLLIASIALAGEVNLEWDRNTESDLDGYELVYGPQPRTVHTVVAGDTLFSLAEQYYSDGHQWPEIAIANGLPPTGNPSIEVHSELIIPLYEHRIDVPEAATAWTVTVDDGTWYFSILAKDESGNKSKYSNEEYTTIGGVVEPPAETKIIQLAWDRNTEDDLDGYKVFAGTEARRGTVTAPQYTVQNGDTWQSIAQSVLGDSGRWAEIVALNSASGDPQVGTKIFAHPYGTAMVDIPLVQGQHPATYNITMDKGKTYYFALVAYDESGNISGFSNEVDADLRDQFEGPMGVPGQPTLL